MDGVEAVIPVRSEREALDWSLVLASQGVEATIQAPNEEHGCQIAVAQTDYGRALNALRQYRLENQVPLWRQPLPWSHLIFDLRSCLWFVLLILIFLFDNSRSGFLKGLGVMDARAVHAGQWWRLFTAVTLHANVAHLAGNTAIGILLLGLAMGSFGSGWGLLASYLAGALGNLGGLVFYGDLHRSLGASGMIMGSLGLLAVQTLGQYRLNRGSRYLLLRGLAGGILLLVLFGMSPNSDVLAHVGGFLGGVGLGSLLTLFPFESLHHPVLNRMAELICAIMVALTWWLALRV
jgi:membrane associated rhomboid family serine protease